MKTMIKYPLTIIFLIFIQVTAFSVNVTGTTGSIAISTYSNNQTSIWDINTTVNYKPVKMNIVVRTELNFDFIRIYAIDVYGHEILIDNLSGTTTEKTLSTLLPTGKARIVFTSDGSMCTAENNLYWGFGLNYEVDNTTTTTGDLKVNGNISGNIAGGALRIQSTSGTLDLGAQNNLYAHIYTDRPYTIFNKPVWAMTGEFSAYSTQDLRLQTSGTTRMLISNSTGNVGIGTMEPDKELTVNGTIHAKEILLDLNGPLADYVFDSKYKLMPISEVEQFVNTNKHLPSIPSASEVKTNGLNMGEMQNKLLQKIEELTLYVIEQQKEINQLKALLKPVEVDK